MSADQVFSAIPIPKFKGGQGSTEAENDWAEAFDAIQAVVPMALWDPLDTATTARLSEMFEFGLAVGLGGVPEFDSEVTGVMQSTLLGVMRGLSCRIAIVAELLETAAA